MLLSDDGAVLFSQAGRERICIYNVLFEYIFYEFLLFLRILLLQELQNHICIQKR